MPNLMERKSTRRVENAAPQPTSVREQVRQWATNLASKTSQQTVGVGDIPVPSRARRGLEARSRGEVWGVKTLCRGKWADFGDTSEDAPSDRKNRRVLALQLSDVLIVKFQTIRFAVLGRQSLRWVPA